MNRYWTRSGDGEADEAGRHESARELPLRRVTAAITLAVFTVTTLAHQLPGRKSSRPQRSWAALAIGRWSRPERRHPVKHRRAQEPCCAGRSRLRKPSTGLPPRWKQQGEPEARGSTLPEQLATGLEPGPPSTLKEPALEGSGSSRQGATKSGVTSQAISMPKGQRDDSMHGGELLCAALHRDCDVQCAVCDSGGTRRRAGVARVGEAIRRLVVRGSLAWVGTWACPSSRGKRIAVCRSALDEAGPGTQSRTASCSTVVKSSFRFAPSWGRRGRLLVGARARSMTR